mmetsp:Transcript_23852/g.44327  ORF Transcript_23852/g.44327 Transcript_23852/m.44327 type:complete len:88 (-) Transcript_23852:696-959(-)
MAKENASSTTSSDTNGSVRHGGSRLRNHRFGSAGRRSRWGHGCRGVASRLQDWRTTEGSTCGTGTGTINDIHDDDDDDKWCFCREQP